MILTYKAIDAEGQKRRDTVEAGTRKEAVEQLRRKGLFVTELEAVPDGKAGVHKVSVAPGTVGLSLKALAMFTRQMAMLLRAGSGVVPAMVAIRKHLTKPAHAALLDKVIIDLEEGNTLAETLRKSPRTFDPTYSAIIQAGEASATLPDMFDRLSTMVGARRSMRNKILGSLAYPVLLMFMSFKILLVMMFFVLPRFAGMFDTLGASVPPSTQTMLDLAQFARGNWWAFVLVAMAMVGGVVWVFRTDAGRSWLENVKTEIPFVGALIRRLIQAQIFRTMGLLLQCRVGVLDTLDLAREASTNARFRKLFDRLEEEVTAGGQLSTAFEESGMVDPAMCQAIRTGEESGNLGGAISFCADILDESNAEAVQVVSKLIEPVILIGMGGVVGTVVVSLFMPLFDLTAAMS